MPCKLLNLCEYETHKLVRIQSVRLGSLKWTFNGVILMFICIMMLWNKEYQEHDYVVSSVTAKVKGVALTSLPDVGDIVWDVVDYSGPSQVPPYGKVCRTDEDCVKGFWDQHSHGVQTGACVKFDVTRKTCEVSAWCPIESKKKPPKPALLASAENFTVLIKNNIRFPNFNFMRRNILPEMTESYLKRCQFNRHTDSSCPIFRLGDIVKEAKENFLEMAVECILCVSFVDENHIRVVKKSHKKSLQQVKPISVHPCKDDTGHLSAMVGVLQKGNNIIDKPPQVLPRPNRPAWCLCGCCLPSTHPQEQLCCRQSIGRCITTSSLFEQLVLSRPLLEAVLLYREPLSDLTEGEQRIAALRNCSYRQYINWRIGAPPRESIPVMPSCSVWRIREEYPSQEGEYTV